MFFSLTNELFQKRNASGYILHYTQLQTKNNKVNLHYYHPEYEKGCIKNNLGDSLSPIVIEYLLNKKSLSLKTFINCKKNLYGIGSIIFMGLQDTTIWGTGIPYYPFFSKAFIHSFLFRKLDIRAVRGPVTKDILKRLGHKCPEIYGDPAVLMPEIFMPKRFQKEDYIIIPHFETEHALPKGIDRSKIVSMQTNDYKMVITKICSAQKVITSSLHGLILSETYGIPAIFYQDRADALLIKYKDWYLSTGRKMSNFAISINEALKMSPPDLPDLSKMQSQLKETFPYDLWE